MLRVAHRRIFKKKHLLFVGVLSFVVSFFCYVNNTGLALSVDWSDVSGARVDVQLDNNATGEHWYMPECTLQRIVSERPAEVYEVDACVVKRAGIELAAYPARSNPDKSVEYAIKLVGDSRFHYIFEFSNNLILLDDGRLVGNMNSAGGLFTASATTLQAYTTSTGPSTSTKSYRIVNPSMIRDGSGDVIQAYRIDVSSNYLYVIADAYGRGGLLVDLHSLQARYVATDSVGTISYNGNTRQAVSDDGKLVAVVDSEYKRAKVYVVDDACGDTVFAGPDTATCYSIDFSGQLRADDRLANTVPFELSFSTDGKKLIMKAYGSSSGIVQATITPDPNKQFLTYLALGDSYSSGEGDIGRRSDGSSYYLPVTDYAKGCHISSRSYPFLLRDAWGINENKMKSVACSGAQILPDYYGRLEGYLGQNNRLKDTNDITNARNVALERFIPGRVPQVEFVKKYQPKVITLTGGGNDVGFGRILSDCATPHLLEEALVFSSDCSYVKEGSGARDALLGSIDTQYLVTKRLIERIKDASPSSKIIIAGYPSFISSDLSACQPNVGFLSVRERETINDMTARLNGALQSAAREMGVSFVDTWHSLDGGRLCEGSEYMTGVWDGIRGRAIDRERFHPNAEGHVKIAQTIDRSGVYSHDVVPSSGIFKLADDFIQTVRRALIDGDIVIRDKRVSLSLRAGDFAPNTTYTATAYSDPKHLGTFRTNTDGSIRQNISFDNVPPGYHMLVLEGTGADGQPLKVYQFIEVHASLDDADGDGVPNDKDTCHFLPYLYDENGSDVCKASVKPDGMAQSTDKSVTVHSNVQQNNSVYRPQQDSAVASANSSKDDQDTQSNISHKPQDSVPTSKHEKSENHFLLIAVASSLAILILITGIIIIWRRIHAPAKPITQ